MQIYGAVHYWNACESIQEIFKKNSNIHSHNTHCRDSHVAKMCIHRAPKVWLDLPINIHFVRTMTSIDNVSLYFYALLLPL